MVLDKERVTWYTCFTITLIEVHAAKRKFTMGPHMCDIGYAISF